ncbi:MAG: SRPBCC domain-containing protein [Ahrensia sp.]|nr:SRPBCC domain-containing protein [Ahrensia sp.]
MSDLEIVRHFKADADKVFAFVTQTEHVLKWWGPEGLTVPERDMDFTSPGPWTSTMVNADGDRFKVSGEVLSVDPPRSVNFTWGWHDDQDRRGHESRVRFDVASNPDGGCTFTLTHSGLPDDEEAARHTSGWESSLRKLERMDETT